MLNKNKTAGMIPLNHSLMSYDVGYPHKNMEFLSKMFLLANARVSGYYV